MFGLSSLTFKLIIAAVLAMIIGGGALYIKHVVAENAALNQQLDAAVALNKANVAAFAQYKDAQSAALAQLAQQHAADVARLNRSAKLKEVIAHAPKTDDGAVAPVLRGALDGLRDKPAPNPSPN